MFFMDSDFGALEIFYYVKVIREISYNFFLKC